MQIVPAIGAFVSLGFEAADSSGWPKPSDEAHVQRAQPRCWTAKTQRRKGNEGTRPGCRVSSFLRFSRGGRAMSFFPRCGGSGELGLSLSPSSLWVQAADYSGAAETERSTPCPAGGVGGQTPIPTPEQVGSSPTAWGKEAF